MQRSISVIIPCYNGKKYIEAALKSVALQGDAIGEIIVVDDASLDGSAEYIESLNFHKLKLHRLDKNGGISVARNRAIGHVTHPYIAFLDADDLWTEGRIDAMLNTIEESTKPWAFGAIEHFISEDCATRYSIPPVQTGYFASAMLIETEFFHKVGLFNESFRVGEFIDWYNRAAALQIPPALLNSVVLKRRIHGANSSIIAGNKHANDYLRVAREAIVRKKSN